jgi:hypothetical protein
MRGMIFRGDLLGTGQPDELYDRQTAKLRVRKLGADMP